MVNPQQMVDGVVNGAKAKAADMAEDAKNGFFSHIIGGVKGFFNIGNILKSGVIGGAILTLFPTIPDAVARALGGEKAANMVKYAGTTDDGAESIGRRFLVNAGISALAGSALSGAGGLVKGDAKENEKGGGGIGGALVTTGLVGLVAAVVMGSMKNGNLQLADTRDIANPGATPSAPPRPVGTQKA
jgi:hypothetical protein